jgi:phospholipase C
LKVSDDLSSKSTCTADKKVNITGLGAEAEEYQLPYNLDFKNSKATCMAAPQMGFGSDIGIWNNGHMDAWNTARDGGFGMSYFNRTELPYYYTLADEFTIAD